MTKQIVSQALGMLHSRGKIGKMVTMSGANIVMSCPFTANHGGRTEQQTPSFAIHEEEGKWQCFSCGRRAPTVYALYSSLMGISDEESKSEVGEPKFSANMVLDHLESLRSGKDPARPQPMEPYPATVRATDSLDATKYLVARNIPRGLADEVGLQYFSGHRLPTFSGKPGMSGKRILFPLLYGKEIVGYSARAIFPDSYGPKYYRPVTNVNSLVYNPRNITSADTKHIFVVEGEFSCLACLRENLPAVGTFGASVSRKQAEFLAKFENVIMLFDPDVAGDIGAGKAYSQLQGYTSVRKFCLPGQDPADMAPGFGEVLMKMAKNPPATVDPLDSLKLALGGK